MARSWDMHGSALDFEDRQGAHTKSQGEDRQRQGFWQETSNLTMSVLLADAAGPLGPW